MAEIRYPPVLTIDGPDRSPLGEDELSLDEALLDKVLGGMILSVSGWRGVFAASGDGESAAGEIGTAHKLISAAAASVFAEYLKKTFNTQTPALILGMDTRPTGPAIADCMIRAFLAEGCRVRFAFITAAPEMMAYARHCGELPPEEGQSGQVRGFAYISASHNPIGYNGFKFGLTDGGVLPGPEAAALAEDFRARMSDPRRASLIRAALIRGGDRAALGRIYREAREIKQEAYSAYLLFTHGVVSGFPGSGPEERAKQNDLLDALARGIHEHPLGILVDFNGSARTMSMDRDFLCSLGIAFRAINDRPGEISHRIVPEGESLEPCRRRLEELHREDGAFLLAYVPDCDGDRGNLIIWDQGEGRARILEAQEVFALACVAELAHLVWAGELRYDNKGNALQKAAVAVNDPTSMRIDRIARAFDVSVFRAEVGEANVVGLARKLRDRGYMVRILGEGSAGGNITHPSAVRDPIDTVLALVKLLTLRSGGGKKGLFELWCNLSDQAELYRPDFSLPDIIASLPAFITTGAYSGEAQLRVNTADHGLLKERYQAIFLRDWEERRGHLKTRYGITGWIAAAYIGTEEKLGITRFSEAGRGGLKIIFTNQGGHQSACLWMRGSGTEPVFRVMADAEGPDRRLERELIEWQRRMVMEADRGTDAAASV
jgi:phosphoglucomutase